MPPVNSTGGICYKGEKSAYDKEPPARVPLSAESGKGFAPSPHHLLKKVDENFQYLYAPLLPQQKIPGKMPGISDFYDYAKSSACSSIFDKNQLCPLSGLP